MPLDDEKTKFGKISVQIEEFDESWALKLLNESEQEDYLITVQDEENHTHLKQKELSLISERTQLMPKSSRDESFIQANKDSANHHSCSLSAIEYQLLEQARRNQENYNNLQNPNKTRVSFSRIKAFFVA